MKDCSFKKHFFSLFVDHQSFTGQNLSLVLKISFRNLSICLEGKNMSSIDIGDQAPSFEMVNQDGNSVSLADYKGKFLLMWWYPKADTPG